MSHVLVIDDDRIILTIIEASLSKAGYTVVTATDGCHGLDVIMNQLFDGVVVDRRMPCLDGLELIRRVREELHLTDLPILMLTAEADLREEALEAGATDYLSKPFRMAELQLRLENMLETEQTLSTTPVLSKLPDGG